jgi:hypothetical protein
MASALYLCCLIITGYPVVTVLARGASRLEIAALSICLGPAIMGILLISLSMLGIKPATSEIAIITTLFVIASIFAWKNGPKPIVLEATRERTPLWWKVVCIIGIGYACYAVATDIFFYPVIEWDAFAIWQLKAKVLATFPLRPMPAYFSNVNLSYSHLRYPVLVPMISAGMHAITGQLDDAVKATSALWFVGTGAIIYAAAKRLSGPTAALTAIALFLCTQPVTHFAGTGTAEMALTAFFACSVFCLLRWQETGILGYAILAAVFGAAMAWTKNEGLAICLVNAVVLLAFANGKWRRGFAAAGVVLGITAVLYLPWILYTHGLPRTDEDYAGRLNLHQLLANAGRIGTILLGFGSELINWQDFGLFWIIAAALAILQYSSLKKPPIAMLATLTILQIAVYIPVLVVTNWKVDELMAVTLGRLFMHAAPAGAILVGALWPQWLGGTRSTD